MVYIQKVESKNSLNYQGRITINMLDKFLYSRFSEMLIEIVELHEDDNNIMVKIKSEILDETSLNKLWDYTIKQLQYEKEINII